MTSSACVASPLKRMFKRVEIPPDSDKEIPASSNDFAISFI